MELPTRNQIAQTFKAAQNYWYIFQLYTDVLQKLSGESEEVACKFYAKEPNWPIRISCFGGCHNGGSMERPGLISLSGTC